MGIYIPTSKRARLLKYKYSSTDKSLTSKYILNPYWTWLVSLFPTTMAPNLITLSGLLCVVVNFACLLYYNPTLACEPKPLHVSKGGVWDPLSLTISATPTAFDVSPDASNWLKKCAPRWIYFTFAFGLFAYQSLDAIDGKQARRTGTSGPLGELFDHGCDALNTTLEVMLTASAMNLGLSWWTVISLVATNANFYLTTWEEFHTGTLFLSVFSGPVEGIWMIIVAFIVTGIYGPSYWDQGILTVTRLETVPFIANLHIKNLPVNDTFLSFSAIALLWNIVSSTINVLRSLPQEQRASPIAVSRCLLRLSPWVVHTLALVSWLYFTPEIFTRALLVPFLCFWGISFAHHVGLLILSHLTASKFPSVYKHPLLILSVIGSLDASGYLWTPVVKRWGVTGLDYEIYAFLAASVAVHSHFVYEVINDICDFYDINCLTIKKNSRGPPPSAKDELAADEAAHAGKKQALSNKKGD